MSVFFILSFFLLYLFIHLFIYLVKYLFVPLFIRCYLPSGKVLWLCPEHQKLPRVTILDDQEDQDEILDEAEGAEVNLLNNLRKLDERTKTKTQGEQLAKEI